MSRMAFISVLVLLSTASLASASGFTETSVKYRSDVQLGAALLVPDGKGPFPGAVIIQGSGNSDRTNLWARSWAEELASRGIVTLLTDKRGCGESEGDWRSVGFDALARDAIAGVRYLQGTTTVRPDIVGIVGLSQGGHIAPLVANLYDEIAYVVDVSGSATTPVEQVDHEMRNTFRQAGLSDEDVELGMELQRLAAEYLRTRDWEPYAAALEASKDTPIASIAAGFPQSPDSWVWAWWRKIADFDPLPEWNRLDIPSLVIYGQRDDEDNTPVTESVRRLESIKDSHPNLELMVIKESGHAIYAPGSTSLHPDALDRIEMMISSLR